MRRVLVPVLAATGLTVACGPPIPSSVPTPLPARATAVPQDARVRLFLDSGCGGCHTLDRVSSGVAGPNLTNIALRPTLAGDTIANTQASLALWLLDPPALKPGSRMPRVGLSPEQAQELAAFLFSQPNAP